MFRPRNAFQIDQSKSASAIEEQLSSANERHGNKEGSRVQKRQNDNSLQAEGSAALDKDVPLTIKTDDKARTKKRIGRDAKASRLYLI